MIIGTDDRKGPKWPLFAAALVGGVRSPHRRGVVHAEDRPDVEGQGPGEQASAVVRQTDRADRRQGLTSRNRCRRRPATKLRNQLRNGVLAAGVIVRVRVFAQNGPLLFFVRAGRMIRGPSPRGADAIRSAAGGAAVERRRDGRVSIGARPSSSSSSARHVRLQGARRASQSARYPRSSPIPASAAASADSRGTRSELGLAAAAAVFLLITLLLLFAAARRQAGSRRAHSRPATHLERRPGLGRGGSEARTREVDAPERTSGRQLPPDSLQGGVERRRRRPSARSRSARRSDAAGAARTRIREQEDQAGRHVMELTQQLRVAAAPRRGSRGARGGSGDGEAAQRLAAARYARAGSRPAQPERSRPGPRPPRRVTELEGSPRRGQPGEHAAGCG